MANMMLKLKISSNLVWFGFGCKSLCVLQELWLPFLWFLIMAKIQDGWYDVKVEDWPKLSGVQFWLQVSMLPLWVIIATFVILVIAKIQDGWHDVKVEDWPKLSGVWIWLQVSMLPLWVIIATLWFLVMAEIQDGWHDVKVEDWPKLSGVQFWLQVSMLSHEL